MDESANKTGGWLNSIRRAGGSLLGLAQSRFELFALELEEEKLRTLSLLVRLVVALTLVVAGLLVGLGALAIYLWEVAGCLGPAALGLALLAAGAAALLGIRRGIRRGPMAFAETIAEFRKDRECLQSED